MKRISVIAAMLICLGTAWAQGEKAPAERAQNEDRLRQKPVNVILNINPLGLLISPDIDGFEATGPGQTEEISGYGSFMPNLKVGLNFDAGPVDIDVTAGAGWLWNGAFYGGYYTGEIAVAFASERDHFSIGPHVGIISLSDGHWDGDADIDLEGDDGWYGGVRLTVGAKKASFYASVDYVEAAYDVVAGSGWTTSEPELDISGFMITLGVIFRL